MVANNNMLGNMVFRSLTASAQETKLTHMLCIAKARRREAPGSVVFPIVSPV
ncbi:MAG: hypothetical protein NVSMB31_19980 [Vulcanimicrobiaceae bacterium]